MEYSFNHNQTIPKYMKKKVTIFCLFLQKSYSLVGHMFNKLNMFESFLPDHFPSVEEYKL